MAANYTEFSEVIPKLTEAESDWLQKQLEVVCVFGDVEYAEDELPDDLCSEDAEWIGCRAYRDMEDYDQQFGDGAGFEYEFPESDQDKDRDLWIGATEYGYIECAAHLVRKFLERFRPDDCWSLTWASTCSKPRIGEFGGGAVFVTASEIAWDIAHEFVEQRRAAFAASETAAEPNPVQPGHYHLTIDGPMFRQQRELLQRLRGFAEAKRPYWPAPGEAELLDGLIGLTDEMADQAHDNHGVDCLLDTGADGP